MSYSGEIRDEVFERLGVYVHLWFDLEEMKTTLDTMLEDAAVAFDISNVGGGTDTPSAADKIAFEAFSAEVHRQEAVLESLRSGVVSRVSTALGVDIKYLLDAPMSSPGDILDYLIDLMDDNGDSVQENDVEVSVVAGDVDNSVVEDDGLTVPTMDAPPTQRTVNDSFCLVCADGSTVGQERWDLHSARLGRYPGQIVTDTPADWDPAGIHNLTVDPAPRSGLEGLMYYGTTFSAWQLDHVRPGFNTGPYGHIAVAKVGTTSYTITLYKGYEQTSQNEAAQGSGSGTLWPQTVTLTERNNSGLSGTVTVAGPDETDTDEFVSKVLAWDMTGVVRGVNASAEGRLWLRFVGQVLALEEGDDLHQVENWSNGIFHFGFDTDADGRGYVSVVKEPGTYEVIGGVTAHLDASAVVIDDADGSNTDEGTLYAMVLKENGTTGKKYTIQLFNNEDRAAGHKVAEGFVDNVTDGDFPLELTLDPAAGGVGASLTLTSFDSTLNGTDSSIQIRVPRYFVRFYRSEGRAVEDLSCEAVSYEPNHAELMLQPAPGHGMVIRTDLAYVQDNESIRLRLLHYPVDVYRADPAATDTTDADLVGRGGDMSSMQYTDNTVDISPLNDSGLSGSLHYSNQPFPVGLVMSAVFGYATGDAFSFGTTTDVDGRFQTFLRDGFGKVFPSGDAPTVSEGFAGGGS